jgi:BCCT, betaine/carnitine/choline family transporter
MLIARLSRGRKLWEVVAYSMAAPAGFCLVWFCIWGGVAIRQSRQSIELAVLGEVFFNSSDHFLAYSPTALCFEVPQHDLVIDGVVVFTNRLLGVTPVCQFNPENFEAAVYNVLFSFRYPETFGEGDGLGQFLSFLFILACVLFFSAISDCSSYVLDSLSSNGRANDKQGVCRMFWILSIGALSTILLSKGHRVALNAIQATIIAIALPFAILLCYLLHSIALLCQSADTVDENNVAFAEYRFPEQPEFKTPIYGGVFNCFEYLVSVGKVNAARKELGMDKPSVLHVREFVKGALVPFISLHQVLSIEYPKNIWSNLLAVLAYTVSYYLSWSGLIGATRYFPGLFGGAWIVFFLVAGCILATVRFNFRKAHNLRSNLLGDLMAGIVFWPQALGQMREHQLLSLSANNTGPIDDTRTTVPSSM